MAATGGVRRPIQREGLIEVPPVARVRDSSARVRHRASIRRGRLPAAGPHLRPISSSAWSRPARRLPPAEQRQALLYVETLERAGHGAGLVAFAGSILPSDLAAVAAAIEGDCERVDASNW